MRITKYEPPAPKEQAVPKGGLGRKKQAHELFHSYNGLANLEWFPSLFKEGDEVIIQEKLHGCLRNDEMIELIDGTKKSIQQIVDNKLEVIVWGLDHETNKIIPTKVTNWFNNGKTNNWLKVKYSKTNCGSGNHFRTLEVTPNHKFWVNDLNEYIEARH